MVKLPQKTGYDHSFFADTQRDWLTKVKLLYNGEESIVEANDESGLIDCLLQSNDALQINNHIDVEYSGRYYLEYLLNKNLQSESLKVNGQTVSNENIYYRGRIPCVAVELVRGKNCIIWTFANKSPSAQSLDFQMRILNSSGELLSEPDISTPGMIEKTIEVKKRLRQKRIEVPDLEGFTSAVGKDIKSIGRFGHTKGDGMLDCSMPRLGVITKPYIFGHPEYKKHLLWHFTILPPGCTPPETEVFRNYHPTENETINADWTGVEWEKEFTKNDGSKVNFSARYSTITPAILMETDDNILRLSSMQLAGNYKQIMLPLGGKVEVRNIRDGKFYDRNRDGDFSDNWFMIFNSGSFPEVPILIFLEENPQEIKVEYNERGKLESIDLIMDGKLGWAVLQFPFGFQVFRPSELNEKFLMKAAERCSLFSKMGMAFPVNCEEYFRIDKKAGTIDIVQHFKYKHLKDQWGSQSILSAPLPPPVSLISDVQDVSFDENIDSFEFATKYGNLHWVMNSEWSSYRLPLPPTKREFAPAKAGKDQLSEILSESFNEYIADYSGENIHERTCCFAGSLLRGYTTPLGSFPVWKPDERNVIIDRVRKVLPEAADYNHAYFSKHTPYSLTPVPEDAFERFCYYERIEPFSGIKYLLTYLRPIDIASNDTRQDILERPWPFNEVDWGNGFTLYQLYLGALVSEEWNPIKKNWETIKKVFDFFLVYMDWACMSAPYHEAGITWCEGTNYGGYIGFVRMAEIIGDKEAEELGLYALAKQGALRLAQFASGKTYFSKHFRVKPYYLTKHFHEELIGSCAYANYPAYDLLNDELRITSLYFQTNEGYYPEAWQLYGKFMPNEVAELLNVVQKNLDMTSDLPWPELPYPISHYRSTKEHMGEAEIFSFFMFAIYSNCIDYKKLDVMLEKAFRNQRIVCKYIDNNFTYRLPENWAYCYIKSLLRARMANMPLLLHWKNMTIKQFLYDFEAGCCSVEIANVESDAEIAFNGSPPQKIIFENRILVVENTTDKSFTIQIPKAGLLSIEVK